MEWISVNDRTPSKDEDEKEFLVYVTQVVNDNIEVAQWWDYGDNFDFNIGYFGYTRRVTHWMELPEPPRK